MANVVVPEAHDHRSWAAYWGNECQRTITRYLTGASEYPHLTLEHVHRCARMAWWHAARLKKYKYWDDRWRSLEKENR